MRNNPYLLLVSIVLGFLALLGNMYRFIDNAMCIVLLFAAAVFLFGYMYSKYSRLIRERKNKKDKNDKNDKK